MTVGSCSGPQRNTGASDKRCLLAQDLLHRGEIDAAEAEAKRALELDPQNADAYEILGDAELVRADRQAHFASIDQCAEGQEAADYTTLRDQALRAASGWFEKAVAVRADDARALDNLGVAALNLGDWDAVIRADGEAVAVEDFPARYLAQGDLGWAYYHKGDLLHAIEQLKLALAQAPDYCVGRYRLGEVYFAEGKLDEAAANAKAVDAKLSSCPIQENERLLGLVEVKRDDLPTAARYFRKCLQFSPKSCVAQECARYLGQVTQ